MSNQDLENKIKEMCEVINKHSKSLKTINIVLTKLRDDVKILQESLDLFDDNTNQQTNNNTNASSTNIFTDLFGSGRFNKKK